ncbi:hypothetical protein OH491_21770 [Termitidicoccus mucosus]|uniref:Uncharacterized protein n=1 Tax=Termitidicoccus mucosus TaxID=1184151 RepID=A0A178IC38_9BACT|nr:hypothetical protein AW736_21945 [Opitutaceae bacterium TSB47]
MSWWNPFTWGGNTAVEQTIVDQAAHDTLLLAQARADAGAGVIAAADYLALRDTFLRVHGAAALAAFDANAPAVPAGATIGDIKDYLGEVDIDMSAFQEPARDSAQGKIDDIKDKAVVDAVKDIPRQLAAGLNAVTASLPSWVKFAAIAAVALFALHTLARLGVRVPRSRRAARAK